MITIYRCGFCGKEFDDPRSAVEHEEGCSHNPKHKTCFSCRLMYVLPKNSVIRCFKHSKQYVARLMCEDWEPPKQRK